MVYLPMFLLLVLSAQVSVGLRRGLCHPLVGRGGATTRLWSSAAPIAFVPTSVKSTGPDGVGLRLIEVEVPEAVSSQYVAAGQCEFLAVVGAVRLVLTLFAPFLLWAACRRANQSGRR